METFNNYIDEFVDWVTGEDTSSQEQEEKIRVSSTGGLPVSGGSIRELLQTKLKKPFVYYEDVKAGLYRLFSGEATRDKWIRMNTEGSSDYDPEGSTKLELFSFVRPSDVTMTYRGLDPDPKYVVNGDTSSNATRLQFNVYLSKESGGGTVYESDSFTVTYKVTDSYGVEHTSVEEKDSTFLNSSKKVTKDIYPYLTVGQNTVQVTMKARNSSAQNSVTFPVYLMNFTISSTFDYSTHWDPSKQLIVPVSVRRSDTSLTLQVDIYIDRTSSSPGIHAGTWTLNSQETNPTKVFYIDNNYAANSSSSDHIKHTLMITASLYNADSGEHHYSNVLFYDFIVASNAIGIVNKFVTTGYELPYNKVNIDNVTNRVIISGQQYEPIYLDWAYYTDRDTTGQTVDIQWAIKVISNNDVVTYTPIRIVEGQNHNKGETFKFIPDFDTEQNPNTYLAALIDGQEVDVFPLSVTMSSLSVSETGGYNLKLSAYGKTNSSPDKDSWTDIDNNVTTTFTNIMFDDNSGWNNDSFITSGTGQYITIDYCPLPGSYNLAGSGKTIEIDFMPEKVANDGDTVILIGDTEKGHIRITTNEASVYSGTSKIVHTNYKANERIKLAFIFNPVSSGSYDSNLVYIVNNGILERAAQYGTAASYLSSDGRIKIGGSESGVRVYNMRCYNKALSYDEALSNYMYDSDDKGTIINRNDIFTSSVIDYTKVKNKIDTVVIEGNLTALLTQSSNKDDSTTTVNFKRECVTDASKTFEVINGMIRKHGQSTLNYPITSLKIWTNKGKDEDNVTTSIILSDAQRAEGLNKNRYMMKTGSIPANKFVLQANYADSSGTHNGALLRLIQDTWYNAVDSEGRHILRTAPQLFVSGEKLIHNDEDLHEDGTWVEGTGVGAAEGKTWTQITNKKFPYIIRNAPDSFPCAVFYKNGPDDGYHFLGQYVFMDDKKSDYTYGERSIYHFGNDNDPFVLRTENTKNGPNGKQDTSDHCVWDNKNVLRIEVVLPNTRLSSYMDFNVTDTQGNAHLCTDIKYDEKGNPTQYYWEDYFELIYPDEDDVAEDDAKSGLTKFSQNSKFVRKVTPFINFLKWITDCKNNYNVATQWWAANTYNSTQEAFEATAHNHLDMYKLAAYYIFFLRFGLVDSVERNAQMKTYDGQHWHYEPWDMDIALGNTNQGALILNPPMTRTSMEPGTTTYAFSGKSATTSNVLWDCLEAWTYWSETVVPNVAKALYQAGLNYDNIINMFDGQYSNAWSEAMYNQSGYFKYVESGGADWLAWLQGSRTSHRHWWISTSMNYYDAKWSCGSFDEHRIRIFADKAINPTGTDIITIKPTSDTFFKVAQSEGKTSLGFLSATRQSPAVFDVSTAAFSAKDPSYIYGGTFIEEIDLSCFAEKFKAADLSLCYDNVLGAPIKKLNVGIPYTVVDSNTYSGKVSGTQFRLTGYDSTTGNDAFANLQILDITGQSTIKNTQELLTTRNRKNITDIYAIGSGITQFSSSTSGNKFNVIKLPGVTTTTYDNDPDEVVTFNTLSMQNSSWNSIEFWDTTKSGSIQYVRDENDEIVLDDDNLPVLMPSLATFTKSTVPSQMTTMQFIGSTARNECSGQLLLDWIDSIDNSLPVGHTEQDLYDALYSKVFEAENINWGTPDQTLRVTYNDLARIAHFNEGNNSGGKIKGYVMLSDQQQLTSVQVASIIQWFGPSAFSKNAKNSSLVIDQNLNYVRLTSFGTTVINNEICLNEGETAQILATKFLLSEDSQVDYDWSIAVGQNVESNGVSQVNSVRLTMGDDGIPYLVSEQNGTYGDYYVTITATRSNLNYTMTIKIIGSILPEGIQINTLVKSGSQCRPFYVCADMAATSEIFRNAIYDENNNNTLREGYVLQEAGQQIEFYPTLVDGVTPSNVGISAVRYQLTDIITTYTAHTQLTGGQDVIDQRIGDDYIYYVKTATRKGIVLGVSTAPNSPRLYTLKVNVVVGGRQFTKNINILVYNDTTVMHTQSVSGSVQNVLNVLHTTLYGNSITQYYKSDLLSLCGELDFSAEHDAIGSIVTVGGDRLLQYITNVTSLNFYQCSHLDATSLGPISSGRIQTVALPYLTTLNLNGTPLVNTLDLTNCPKVETLDLRNTQAGIKLISSSPITSLQLGTPGEVDIQNPKYLTSVSVQSSANLDKVNLVNVNVGDLTVPAQLCGFNIFNTLYS